MALLYPPYIEGTIPAFYGQALKVPFQHNPTVANSDFIAMVVKFKEVNTNTELFINKTGSVDNINKLANFNLTDTELAQLRPNDFYKIQLAYKDTNNNVGYFSTVGVVKFTTEPKLELIRGDQTAFNPNSINILSQEVMGQYTNFDFYEKLYSTQLVIKDEDGNIFYQSEEIIHNNFNDDNNITTLNNGVIENQKIVQYERYNLYKELADNKQYTIYITGTTINGLNCASPVYTVCNSYTFDGFYGYFLTAERNFENGYVEVVLNRDFTASNSAYLKGLFVLCKRDAYDDSKAATWYPIKNLALDGTESSNARYSLLKDFIVEQGGVYQYSLQQYTGKFTTNRMKSNYVTADFEDMFLYDGKRQLKLKFNPKISSFKTTKLENKIDTIGGVYPVFFRNAYTNYKEFPISALISYLSDENNEFMLEEDFGLNNSADPVRRQTPGNDTGIKTSSNRFDIQSVVYKRASKIDGTIDNEDVIYNGNADSPMNIISGNSDIEVPEDDWGETLSTVTYWDASRSTNLNANNYVSERLFKLKVLDWLNNGKPKLFKSAAEGNYIVRLMNISLAPNDQLGRMLHTMSGQAYEVAEINFENLKNYGFINTSKPELKKQLVPYSIDLNDNDAYIEDATDNYHILYLPSNPSYYPQFTNLPLGTKLRFTDNAGVQSVIEIFMRDSYIVEESIPFVKIEISFPDKVENQGLFNIFYHKDIRSYIDYIKNISYETVVIQSFSCGEDEEEIDIISKIKSLSNFKYNYASKTISYDFNTISNIKYLKFEKRDFNLPSTSAEKNSYKIKFWWDTNKTDNPDYPDDEIDLSDLSSYTFPMAHSEFHNIVIGKNIIAYIGYDKQIRSIELDTNELIKEKVYSQELVFYESEGNMWKEISNETLGKDCIDNAVGLTTQYNAKNKTVSIKDKGITINGRESLVSFKDLSNKLNLDGNQLKPIITYLNQNEKYYFSCQVQNPFWNNNEIWLSYLLTDLNLSNNSNWINIKNNSEFKVEQSGYYKIVIKLDSGVEVSTANTTLYPFWLFGYKYKYNLGTQFPYCEELVGDESCVIAFGSDDSDSNQIAWFTDEEGLNVSDSTN